MRGSFVLFSTVSDFYGLIRLCFNLNLMQMPDLFCVLFNCSVGRELTTACSIQKCHSSPSFSVFVCCFYTLLCFCVRTEIFQNEIHICAVAAICIQQTVVQITVTLCISICIRAIYQLVYNSADICIIIVDQEWLCFQEDKCGQTRPNADKYDQLLRINRSAASLSGLPEEAA